MNTLQLEHFLKDNRYTKPYFIGVYPADQLPQKLPNDKTTAFVMNTDPSGRSGRHWLAVIVSRRAIEVFDTGGENSIKLNKYLKKFIHKNPRPRLLYNKYPVQGPSSDVCGEYAALFLLSRMQKISYKRFLSEFSASHLVYNDLKTFYYFLKKFVISSF